jgi:hypothetical protein
LNWPAIGANKLSLTLVSIARREERSNVLLKTIGARGIVGEKIRKP